MVFKTQKCNKPVSILYSTSVDEENPPFWYRDIEFLINGADFVFVHTLFINKEDRNKGLGSAALKEFCDHMTSLNKIIILRSSLLKDEYPEEPTEEQYTEVLERLNKFFINRGFSNINKYTKTYEFSELYVYTDSEIGWDLYLGITLYYPGEE